MNDEPDLRATTQSELLELVPYLLGFHPTESLVLVCLRGRRVACTARVDLAGLDDVDAVGDLLDRLRGSARAERLIAVAYSADAELATRVLDLVECSAVDIVVQDLLRVDDDAWESLCTPNSGRLRTATPVAAEAVYRGMSAAQSRDSVVAVVESQGCFAGWREALAAGRVRVRRWSRPRRRKRLADLLDRPAGEPYEVGELAELVSLVADPNIRDSALTAITQSTAPGLMAAYLQAARQLPDDASCAHILGLFGIAAWVSGQGALMVAAIERGERANPECPLIGLLGSINQMALPPQWWEQVRADLAAA